MAQPIKSTVKADIKKNRLTITLASDPNKSVLEKVYTDVRFCVADLQPGFDVVTDLSQCTVGHLSGLPVFRKIMNFLVTKHPGEIVRVTGGKGLIFKQLIRFAGRFQGYKAIYATTLEEAEDRLTNSNRRNGLRFHMLEQPVNYRIFKEVGQGYLSDISISGCAVREPTIPVTMDKEVFLTIPFQQGTDTPQSFTILAKVTRVQDNLFASQFIDLDDDQKTNLYKCLTYEAQRDIPQA